MFTTSNVARYEILVNLWILPKKFRENERSQIDVLVGYQFLDFAEKNLVKLNVVKTYFLVENWSISI